MRRLERFPTSLRRYLIAFAVRRRVLLALRALGWGLCLWTAWTVASCVADRLFALPEPARWANLAIGIGLILGGVAIGLWHALLNPIDWQLAAERIEARGGVFDERLRTVTSQLLADEGAPERTSVAMVQQTVEQVESLLPTAPVRRLLPWRLAVKPWAVAVGIGLLVAGGAKVRGWQVDRLLGRALFPRRPIEAVTMMRLQVWPRGGRVQQGETVTVSAAVTGQRAAAAAQAHGMDLYLSADGKTWSRAAMNPTELGAEEARFEFVIPAIDRDLRYYVRGAGGDARSEAYAFQVQRVPAVAEFHIRYDYPGYTNHPPVTVTNTDGTVEGLVYSTATVTVVATEPLSSATWVLNGGADRLPMNRLDRPEQWQVSFQITKAGSSALEMTSAAGVPGRGPSPMPVRPLVDKGPESAVLQPTSDVRLEPRDALLVRVAATDDYGLNQLDCPIELNGRPAGRASIPVANKPLRREGEFTLDLAALRVEVGDILSVYADAADSGGSAQFSEPRAILVAPHSVLPRAYERAAELRRAVALARAWHEALNKARKALDAARASDPKTTRPDPWLAAGRAFSAANDAAATLRQAMLRAVPRADEPALADALAAWIDLTEGVLAEPGRPLSPASRGDEALSARLNALIARTRDLPAALDAVQQGEWAAITWLEWQNHRVLAALPSLPTAEPTAAKGEAERKAALERLGKTLEGQLRGLAIAGNATPDVVERQLRERVDRGRAQVAAVRPPDFAVAARDWTARLARPSGGPGAVGAEFAARLEAQAQVQSLRSDGNLVLARDLAVASRAAAALLTQVAREPDRPRPVDKGGPRTKPVATAPAAPAATAATAPTGPAQFQAALAQVLSGGPGADGARQRMQAWAAGAAVINGADPATAGAVEPIALAASAEASEGSYNAAAQDDARLAEEVARWSPEQSTRFAQVANRSLTHLRGLDAVAQEQEALRLATIGYDPAGELAARQRRLAEAVSRLERPADDAPMTVSVGTSTAAEATMNPEDPMATTAPASTPAPATAAPRAPSADLAAHRPTLAAAWEARAAADALDALDAQADDPVAATALRRKAAAHQKNAVALLKVAMAHVNHREALRRLAEVPSLTGVFQPTAAEGATPPSLNSAFDRLGLRAQDWWRGVPGEKGAAPPAAGPAGANKVQDQLQAYFESIAKAQRERK